MLKAVLDSSVLISAFLTNKGVSADLLRQARQGTFQICLAQAILEETERVLLEYQRIRKRYRYSDQSVIQFSQGLRAVAHLAVRLPRVEGVVRDPQDDVVIACALAAGADYLVTRDEDLLTIGAHKGVEIVTPEEFMRKLRET
jgi:putative PIN family toxin of toxin-antitoxin system